MAFETFDNIPVVDTARLDRNNARISSTAAGEGAALVGSNDAGGYWAGTTVEAQLQEAGKLIRGMARDIRTFANIVADGTTDDFAALQAAIVTAEAASWDLFWPEGVYTRVLFTSTNSNIFIHGKISLYGANARNCGIKIGKNYNHTPGTHAPLFAWGIASKGATVDAWVGTMDNLGFVLESSCGTFERLNHFYEWHDCTISNCYADFRATTFTLGQFAGGWFSNNQQPTWATSQSHDSKRIRILNNTGYASCYHQNSEAIGLTYLVDSQVIGNYCEGFADDIAVHGGRNVTVSYNTHKAVAGRFYFEECQGVRVIGNHLERIKDPGGAYLNTTRGIMVAWPQQFVTQYANADVIIRDNTIVMPIGSFCSVMIQVESGQDGITIADNKLWNFGTTDTTGSISITSAQYATWTGPTTIDPQGGAVADPDAGTGGVVRLRSANISGNQCLGPGWAAGEGSCGISLATNGILGPVIVSGNTCGAYNMPYTQIQFNPDNRVLPVSTNIFANVNPLSIKRNPAKTFQILSSANITFANNPVATPATITDSDSMAYYPHAPGSVRGAVMTLTALPGGNVSMRILKNGAQLGSDATVTSGGFTTSQTNGIRYTLSLYAVATDFAEGDRIQVQLYCGAGVVTALSGKLDLLCAFNQ
jgi:hypothetical protein